MNIGTIIDVEMVPVRMRGGRQKALGEVEESFAATLEAGDTFLIGGQVVLYEGLREMTVLVSRTARKNPRIAVFMGTKLATSTRLSYRVQDFLNTPDKWSALPRHTQKWLGQQQSISQLPRPDRVLVETFWRGDRFHTCIYGFAGRNALQTLGLFAGKQATFSSDILYDTLLKYDPDHLLMKITRQEAERGLVDFGRIEEMLHRVGDRIDLIHAPHVTPLAAPLLLEVGKVPSKGAGEETLLEREAEALMKDAGLS